MAEAKQAVSYQSAYANFNIERSLHTPTLNDIWDEGGKVASMAGQTTQLSRTSQGGRWDGRSFSAIFPNSSSTDLQSVASPLLTLFQHYCLWIHVSKTCNS